MIRPCEDRETLAALADLPCMRSAPSITSRGGLVDSSGSRFPEKRFTLLLPMRSRCCAWLFTQARLY